jgi:hypothetical protein
VPQPGLIGNCLENKLISVGLMDFGKDIPFILSLKKGSSTVLGLVAIQNATIEKVYT